MIDRFIIVVLLALCIACGDRVPQAVMLEPAPAAIEEAIHKEFPRAIPTYTLADTLFRYLREKYQVESEEILLGTSTCVDDIIYTKNFHRHPEIKGPFNLGGLAGIPFAGVSGLNAFSHHVPENGTMLLLVGPHIGYAAEGGWGMVLRNGQPHSSSCCGALAGLLKQLETNNLHNGPPDEDDYEGYKLGQFVLSHEKSILNSPDHIVQLTKLAGAEVDSTFQRLLNRVETEHFKYIVIVNGVLINTDYQYIDEFSIARFRVYDVEKKTSLENRVYAIN